MRKHALLVLAVSLTACTATTEIIDLPPLLTDDQIGGLTASVVIEPAAVGPRGEFTLTFTLSNTTGAMIQLDTPNTCLALPEVRRNGQRIPFEGTAWGCGAALTTHDFPPGYEQTSVFQLRAALYSEHPGDIDGAAAPKGSYVVQMVFHTAGNPAVGQVLVVR